MSIKAKEKFSQLSVATESNKNINIFEGLTITYFCFEFKSRYLHILDSKRSDECIDFTMMCVFF